MVLGASSPHFTGRQLLLGCIFINSSIAHTVGFDNCPPQRVLTLHAQIVLPFAPWSAREHDGCNLRTLSRTAVPSAPIHTSPSML